ncbi:unnamed protein product [Brachionus calyciflorus]|uniref:Uncharacterized protein n=1 Tax=Brachionus calyciflorus TaxID=104777 RepID=A0A814MUW3_9BILA|nr:unnamed protein product [Brachionus calyciflorus]
MTLFLKWSKIASKFFDISQTVSKRSSHTTNLINKKIYIFGGEYIPRNPIDNNLLVLDTVSNEWSSLADPSAPIARMGHSSCSVGDNLYIFGGRTGVEMGETSLNDLHSFNTFTKKWSLIHSDTDSEVYPSRRSYHTMTSQGNKLYIFGGCSVKAGRLNDLYEFDIGSQKWTKLPSDESIVARGGACLVSRDQCLYLIGGFCGHELDECFMFDLRENKWTQIESLPRKLSVFACSSINSENVQLVLHGGEVDPSTMGHNGAGEFSSDTYVYDGKQWKYIDLVEKPSSRGWHSSCSDENKFYIYGGNLENNERTDELWCFEI